MTFWGLKDASLIYTVKGEEASMKIVMGSFGKTSPSAQVSEKLQTKKSLLWGLSKIDEAFTFYSCAAA